MIQLAVVLGNSVGHRGYVTPSGRMSLAKTF